MKTRRKTRHHDLQDTIYRLQEQRDLIITKLVRVEAKLQAALKSKNRLEKRLAVSPIPMSVAAGEMLPEPQPTVAADHPDDGIPDFLRRAAAAERDAKALVEIAADKRARAQAKAEKKTAPVRSKALGPDARAMPLSGKAALNYLRTGSR